MKQNLLIVAILVAFLASCNSKSGSEGPVVEGHKTIKLDQGPFAQTPLELTVLNTWHIVSQDYGGRIAGRGKGAADLLIDAVKTDTCVVNLDALKAAVEAEYKYRDHKPTFTGDFTLKNGIGVKFDILNFKGTETDKCFFAIIQAKGKCFIVRNNDSYDTKYAHFDEEKEAVESIK